MEKAICVECSAEFERKSFGFKPKRCPACRPARAAKAAPIQAQAAPLTQLTIDQLAELMEAMTSGQREMVAELVTKLRAPDEETVAKKAEEKARMEKVRQGRLTAAKKAMAAQQARFAACAANGHRNEKGRAVIGGQITSGDGLFHGVCGRCGYEFPPVKPTGDMVNGTTAQSGWRFGDEGMTIQ